MKTERYKNDRATNPPLLEDIWIWKIQTTASLPETWDHLNVSSLTLNKRPPKCEPFIM